ncbi:PAS domain S-box-containing protein [Desulfopila aestuarii DSM 18488]|uniref:histidine kinase n=2 Tax=Desulfopila aestuarii TaxID=231440 RepID=A0A1M7XVN4_9BACT|nr:PAS domain S-box-containing protein [Desulfopila aestuarii DSM 18488]
MSQNKSLKRILVVDDQPENIHILIENLESQYEILFATNGEKALDIVFSPNRPDLILLDVIMPGMSGYEVCAILKERDRSRDIPVIFITAQGQETDETTGFRLGAVDYIIKPFRLPIVEARIKAVLRLEEEMENRKILACKLEDLNKNLEERIKEKTAELEQAHENLKANEKKFRSIFENAIEGIFQSSPDGRLLNTNASMARILGYSSPHDLIATTRDAALLYANPEERNVFRRLLETRGEISGFETQFKKLNGETIWVMLSAKVIRGENGNNDGSYYQGFLVDITEKKRASELELANVRLRELDELKSVLMSTASHDLRSPMTAIMGYSSLMEIDFQKYFEPLTTDNPTLAEQSDKILDRLRVIQKEGDRLIRLVNNFLDLTKFESGCLEWNDKLIYVIDIIEHAVKVIKGQQSKKKKLDITVEYSPGIPSIYCDPDRLMQVIMNLLSNAVKFSQSGSVRITAGTCQNNNIEIRIIDTGPGIPEAERENIFKKFYQIRGDKFPADSIPKGSGLGLAICKQIVNHYEGKIWVESEIDCGSTFISQLPVGKSS